MGIERNSAEWYARLDAAIEKKYGSGEPENQGVNVISPPRITETGAQTPSTYWKDRLIEEANKAQSANFRNTLSHQWADYNYEQSAGISKNIKKSNFYEVQKMQDEYKEVSNQYANLESENRNLERQNPIGYALVAGLREKELSDYKARMEELEQQLANYGITVDGTLMDSSRYNQEYFSQFADHAFKLKYSNEYIPANHLLENSTTFNNEEYLSHISNSEMQTYNYLAATSPQKAAEYRQYLDSLVQQRIGAARAQEIQGMYSGPGKAVARGTEALKSGLSGTYNAAVATLSGNDMRTSASQYAAQDLRAGLQAEGKTTLGFDAMQSIGGMIPGIVAGMANPYAGAAVFGATSAAGAYQEKLAEGWSKTDARTYSFLVGASEAAIGKALGGISQLGGKPIKLVQKILSKVEGSYSGALLNFVGKMISEGREEALQTLIEPAIESAIRGTPYDAPDIGEIVNSAIIGAIVSAGFGTPELIADLATANTKTTTSAPTPPPATESPVNAQKPQGVQETPVVGREAEQAPSEGFNPAVNEENAVTNETVSANIESSSTEQENVNAVKQEGGTNETSEQKTEGHAETAHERGTTDSRTEDSGTGGRGPDGLGESVSSVTEQQVSERTERRNHKVNRAIEKRARGKQQAFAEAVGAYISDLGAFSTAEGFDSIERELRSLGATDAEIDEKITEFTISQLVSLALNDESFRGDAVALLESVGVKHDVAEAIINDALLDETLDADERITAYENLKEEASINEAKPMSIPTPVDNSVKAEVSHTKAKDGSVVATITKAGSGAKLAPETKSVKFANEKYSREANDSIVGRNRKTGSYIVERGKENYFIVDKNGHVIGSAVDELQKARSILFGSSNTYEVASVPIAVSSGEKKFIYWEDGQLKLDTDSAFTDQSLRKTQLQSAAAEDLGVEFNTYSESALTTDMFFLDFSALKHTQDKRLKADGKRDLTDALVKRDGIVGANGKKYVFAGQTSNQSKKNIAIFMEETAYNNMRKKMVGGLDPKEVAKFNPVKYLANRGTYFTPSNADTGVKLKDALVVGDIEHVMHAVTRRFLRTTNDGLDYEKLLKIGYSPEEATAKLNNCRVGEVMLVTGDLTSKITDGTGFIKSDKGESFQFRSLGGFKGLLQNFDFVGFFESTIPFDADSQYVWRSDNGEEILGGIRYQSKELGVEMLNIWGEWIPIKDKKALLFGSTVKFGEKYRNQAGYEKAVGDADIRSLPKENVYGNNPDEGMVEGFKRRSLAQVLRSQTALTDADFAAVAKENVTDVIDGILADPKKTAKLFGVDFDAKAAPPSGDVKATMIYYFGEKFLETKLAKKWVANKLGQIVSDARGGQLYFAKDKTTFEWTAPDPLGILSAMTSIRQQEIERRLVETKVEGRSYKGYKGLESGEIANAKLGEGTTLVARYPSMESTDAQIRKNVRNAVYDELVAKYGLAPDTTYFALNDTLSLNLDNDYDGDTVLNVQGALAEAIARMREKRGSDKATGAKIGELFTEFVHGQGKLKDITDADVIAAAVKAGLDAEDIGKFDIMIDYISSMPDDILREVAKDKGVSVKNYRSMLTATFAAAYKFNVDYAKTGYYPAEFKSVVDDYRKEMRDIAKKNGYFVGYYEPMGKYFEPVPAHWQFSPKANKRAKFEEALALRQKLMDEGKEFNTVFRGASNIQSQLYEMLGLEGLVPPNTPKDFKTFFNFYFPDAWKIDKDFGVDFASLSTVNSHAYSNYPAKLFEAIDVAYAQIMKANSNKAGNEHRVELLKKLYNALGLNNEQFASIMLYTLSITEGRDNWDTFLNFDQKDGTLPVSKIIARNAKVLANIATIEKSIKETSSAMDSVESEITELRRKLHDSSIKGYDANEVIMIENADSLISELDGVTAELSEKLAAAEKQTGDATKSIETLVEESETLAGYVEKIDSIKDRLASIEEEVDGSVAIQEGDKALLKEITSSASEVLDNESRTLESLYRRLLQLDEDYQHWLESYENADSKRQFYGVGLSTETGLEGVDIAELIGKIDRVANEAYDYRPTARLENGVKPSKRPIKSTASLASDVSTEAPKLDAPKVAPDATPMSVSPEVKAVIQPDASVSTKEPLNLQSAYNNRYETVKKGIERIANGVGENGDTAVPESLARTLGDAYETTKSEVHSFAQELLSAVVAGDDGSAIISLSKDLPDRIKASPVLKQLLGDEHNGNIAKAAEDVRTARNATEFQNAVSDLVELFAKEVEEFPRTIEIIEGWKANASKTDKVGRIRSFYGGRQRNMVGVFKGLDNHDKYADGPGYQIAKVIEDSNYHANNLTGSIARKLETASSAFESSSASKRTVTVEVSKSKDETSNITISLEHAIDLLHLFESVEESKINAWEQVSYVSEEGTLKFQSEEQYIAAKSAFESAINFSPEAKAYYDALSEAYFEYSEPVRNAVSTATGRTVGNYRKGKYYPIQAEAAKNGEVDRDFDYGLDSTGSTRRRVGVSGGVISVKSPAERFSNYSYAATNLISRAEVSSIVDRLDRGGVVDSLSEVVKAKYGATYKDLVSEFKKNASGVKTVKTESDKFWSGLRINVQGGAMLINVGNMIKQLSSPFYAVGTIDFMPMMHGIAQTLFDENARASGLEVGAIHQRRRGYIDPSTLELLQSDSMFKEVTSKIGLFNLLKSGYEKVDTMSMVAIYLGAKYQVEHRDGLSPSDAKYEERVESLFKDAFLKTQPQYDSLMRAYTQVSSHEIDQMIGMFKTQQLTNFNYLVDTVSEFKTVIQKYGKDSKEYKETSSSFRKIVAGQFGAAVVYGLLDSISDVVMHRLHGFRDDEEKSGLEKALSNLFMTCVEAIAGTTLLGDKAAQFLFDVASRGEANRMIGGLFGALSSVDDAIESITDFAANPSLSRFKYSAGRVSTLGGMPLDSAYAILNSITMYTLDFAGKNPEGYDDILKLVEKSAKEKRELTERITGNSPFENVFNALTGKDVTPERKAAQNVIKGLYEELGTEGVLPPEFDGKVNDDIKLTDKEKEAYQDNLLDIFFDNFEDVYNSPEFANADKELQAKIIKQLSDFSRDQARQDYYEANDMDVSSIYSTILNGRKEPGEEFINPIEPENVADFITKKTAYSHAQSVGDYDAIDDFVAAFESMPQNYQQQFLNAHSEISTLVEAKKDYKIDAKNYYAVNDSIAEAAAQMDEKKTSTLSKMSGIYNADVSDEVKDSMADMLLGENAYAFYMAAKTTNSGDPTPLLTSVTFNDDSINQAEAKIAVEINPELDKLIKAWWENMDWDTPYDKKKLTQADWEKYYYPWNQ